MTDKPKRRWYQYSLRSLFVLMTLFAFACSWYAYEMNEASERRAAIAEIERLEGYVLYYDATNPATQGEPPRWFEWLRKLHGDKQLGNAAWITFHTAAPITDAGLANLNGLAKLEALCLGGTPITDAGLVHLKGLTNLKKLSLGNTQVTYEGVKNLHQALPNCVIAHNATTERP